MAISSPGGPVAFRLAMSQPPTIALQSPTNDALFLLGSSVTLEAQASDPEGALSRVDFYIDFQRVGTVTNSPYRFDFVPRWSHYIHTDGWLLRRTGTACPHDLRRRISQWSRHPRPTTISLTASCCPGSSCGPDRDADYAAGTAWWTWRAPASGTVTVQGRDWQLQRIMIYTGNGPDITDLTLLREGNSAGFTFEAVAGTATRSPSII